MAAADAFISQWSAKRQHQAFNERPHGIDDGAAKLARAGGAPLALLTDIRPASAAGL
jgi:hypothetical protein